MRVLACGCRCFVVLSLKGARAYPADCLICAVCLTLALGAIVPPAAAPGGSTVTGMAKDALERPLPGAELRLETSGGQVVGRTTADEQGRFTFTDVAPGTYVVVGEREGFEPASAVVSVSGGASATAALTLAAKEPLDVKVVAQCLEEARISIQPRIGASTYEITREVIEHQPGGENSPLSRVLLQAPGVSQDSSQSDYIHVRNEHANVQYRINRVPLPEGVSLFGESGGLSPRFCEQGGLDHRRPPRRVRPADRRHRRRADQERRLRAGRVPWNVRRQPVVAAAEPRIRGLARPVQLLHLGGLPPEQHRPVAGDPERPHP
jgi:hypothetical protein